MYTEICSEDLAKAMDVAYKVASQGDSSPVVFLGSLKGGGGVYLGREEVYGGFYVNVQAMNDFTGGEGEPLGGEVGAYIDVKLWRNFTRLLEKGGTSAIAISRKKGEDLKVTLKTDKQENVNLFGMDRNFRVPPKIFEHDDDDDGGGGTPDNKGTEISFGARAGGLAACLKAIRPFIPSENTRALYGHTDLGVFLGADSMYGTDGYGAAILPISAPMVRADKGLLKVHPGFIEALDKMAAGAARNSGEVELHYDGEYLRARLANDGVISTTLYTVPEVSQSVLVDKINALHSRGDNQLCGENISTSMVLDALKILKTQMRRGRGDDTIYACGGSLRNSKGMEVGVAGLKFPEDRELALDFGSILGALTTHKKEVIRSITLTPEGYLFIEIGQEKQKGSLFQDNAFFEGEVIPEGGVIDNLGVTCKMLICGKWVEGGSSN